MTTGFYHYPSARLLCSNMAAYPQANFNGGRKWTNYIGQIKQLLFSRIILQQQAP
jgi:hypothetical protein